MRWHSRSYLQVDGKLQLASSQVIYRAQIEEEKEHRRLIDNGVPIDRKRIIGCAEVVLLLCSKISSDTPGKLLSLPLSLLQCDQEGTS